MGFMDFISGKTGYQGQDSAGDYESEFDQARGLMAQKQAMQQQAMDAYRAPVQEGPRQSIHPAYQFNAQESFPASIPQQQSIQPVQQNHPAYTQEDALNQAIISDDINNVFNEQSNINPVKQAMQTYRKAQGNSNDLPGGNSRFNRRKGKSVAPKKSTKKESTRATPIMDKLRQLQQANLQQAIPVIPDISTEQFDPSEENLHNYLKILQNR